MTHGILSVAGPTAEAALGEICFLAGKAPYCHRSQGPASSTMLLRLAEFWTGILSVVGFLCSLTRFVSVSRTQSPKFCTWKWETGPNVVILWIPSWKAVLNKIFLCDSLAGILSVASPARRQPYKICLCTPYHASLWMSSGCEGGKFVCEIWSPRRKYSVLPCWELAGSWQSRA